MAVCEKQGCRRPVYVEPRTSIAHKYCGRSHALEAEGYKNVKAPHGVFHVCNFQGCHQPVAFDPSTGRVHDFCSPEHANQAIRSGTWPKPIRDAPNTLKTGTCCLFPNCRLPVYRDATTGHEHDYCGRSHAVEHRQMQHRVGHIAGGTKQASSSSSVATRIITNSSGVAAARSGLRTPTSVVPNPQCVICLAMNADIIIIPCGHVCLCKEDADKLVTNMQLVECPLCKQQVTSTNKVFLNR